MKDLYGIAFISLALLFACGEKEENTQKGGSKSVDPVAAIMPDSSLLRIDMVHLYALRDSNLALYEQSKQQEHYQQAVQYNAQYRLYNDSILQIQRNRELADVRIAYDHEKLIGEQNQLTLEKTKIQTMWMIVLFICLCIGGGAFLFYQRRLIRKERAIREAKKHMQELTEQIALNQLTIRSNENLIQTIEEQLIQQTNLEEYVREQQGDIERMRETNAQLLHDNGRLANEVKKYTSLIQDAKAEQSDLDRLLEKNQFLQEKEKYFLELLIQQLKTVGSLKENPLPVTPEESKQLMDEMEIIYPGFVAYLHESFSRLTDLDLLTCCLIKLKFSIPQIAIITCVDITTVSKRKFRIKKTICELIPDIWDEGESLDFYIYKLTPYREK